MGKGRPRAELVGPVSHVGVRGGTTAVVDASGRVCLWDGAWVLDWWIGADDRWHRPASEVSVRQRRLSDGPVIETAVRVPGGDAVLRLYGARLADSTEDQLVVEVANQSHLPFAVALAVGPAREVALHGRVVTIDGDTALIASRPPSRIALDSPFDELFGQVATGEAEEATDRRTRDGSGWAGAALLWPLPHAATLRALVPLDRQPFDDAADPAPNPAAAPAAEQVARGWRRQLDASTRAEVPDPTVQAAITAARAELVLAGSRLLQDPLAALRAVRAACRWGHDDVARAILAALTERVESDNHVAGWVALLSGLAEHYRLDGDRSLAEAAVGTVAAGVGLLDRAMRRRRRLDAGIRAVCHQAMLDGARLLEAAGEWESARQVRQDAARHLPTPGPHWFVADLAPPAELPVERDPGGGEEGFEDDGDLEDEGVDGLSSSPIIEFARAGAEAAGGNAAGWDRIREVLASSSPTWTWTEGSAGPLLLNAVRSALVVEVETEVDRDLPDAPPMEDQARSGDGSELVGTPPDRIPPDRIPPDRVVESPSAARQPPPGPRRLGLELVPGWSAAWWGQPVAAYGLPTAAGALSFAIRWHGDRPALLWEIDRSGAVDEVELRAPTLDPAWHSADWRGEALLAAHAAPQGDPNGQSESFS